MHPRVPSDPIAHPLIEFQAPHKNLNSRAEGPRPLESTDRRTEALDATPARTRPRIQDSPLLASALKSSKLPASHSPLRHRTVSSLLLNDPKPPTASRSRHSVSFADDTADEPATLHTVKQLQKPTGEIRWS